MRVAAAIPAFQAARSVGEVVRRTRDVLADVIVVDDGSSDGTGDAARDAGADVLVHAANRGKGAALVTAFHALFARGHDAVVTVDADGQHLPEEIPKLLAASQAGADLVLGTRDHLFGEMVPARRLANQLSSWAISLAAGRPLRDVQTGFRLYARRLVEATGFPETRFDAESAVVVRAARRGFTIVAVPVRLGFADGRTTSHFRPLVDSLRIARSVVRARLDGANPAHGPGSAE
ncbi:MAG TPA: glycosyltransferase family 2 protein [Vicinamibacteria bacterium]|nr:glycosyltransferase family 2 protein [Vicinamibacteria bacterium]